MPNANTLMNVRDTDLPPMNRTQANYWQAEYYKCLHELQIANKALVRKARFNARLRARLADAGKPTVLDRVARLVTG